MAHRSNQAVASQGQAPPQAPDEPPSPRLRLLIGWATALAALGVSTLLLGLGLWMIRFSAAEFFIGAYLADRGAEADFQVVKLDFDGVTLAGVRFGAETAPDAAIASVEAAWDWRGLGPSLRSVRLVEPRLRLRIDPAGRVSAGALDRIGGRPGRRRPALPQIELEIVDGQALIEAPFGALTATFRADGALGRDFAGVAELAETSRSANGYALERGAAELVVVSRGEAIAFRLNADIGALTWGDAHLEGASLRVMGRTPLDLARYDVEAAWRVASVRTPSVSAEHLGGAFGMEALALPDALRLGNWEAQGRLSAASMALDDDALSHPRIDVRAQGLGGRGRARWTLGAERFAGLAMISERPSASGEIAFDADGAERLQGGATITLARARLDAAAQQRLRDAFPNLSQAPVGPTFAQAERALDRAADAFDLTIPITIGYTNEGVRLTMTAPAVARAASGVTLTLAPLRADAPALLLQWPGPSLHGAVAVELAGGGAPSASLLLDTVDWRPREPFEADGTLTLANWRSAGASIAADELGVAIAIAPSGDGRIDFRGPARITGPLGDGEVRDLVATLDLAVHWGGGWRLTPNQGCLPMRLGGLDAAGLSFVNGAFALCPLGDAIIAADAQRNLSGGFVIQQLALNGRMAGPAAQPARLTAANVIGRFGGRTGDARLALEADAPALVIDMARDRRLSVTLNRILATAVIADSWRVDGAFEQGALSDPALPGAVSTIEGAWSAAPEDGRPVIRVTAGEALLTAHPPSSDDERPLFNPVRLMDVDGTLRAGHIDANGAVVLEGAAVQLALFTAFHDIDEGLGGAEIRADALTFGQTLQPYDITERARGMIESVRGQVNVVANISWTRNTLASSGSIGLLGVSMATSTIPVVSEVRGVIHFDDLFELTTPPGQSVTVGVLNPGIEVRNGRVRFQLLADQYVSVEHAEFDFAAGTLAMSPTTIRLGEDETRIELTLRDVDAADMIANLNIPDLTATGRMEGSFPLLLTRRTAYVENGVLRALPGGGFISYTGDAGADSAGPARIAFDALRSFRYDDLLLTLNGDISGDVVTLIEFSGRNSGEPVDLGAIAPVPGLGRVSVRGVPFDFNVTVTAPFRRLAQAAASFTDPGLLLNRSREEDDEEQQPVDQEADPPR